MLQYLILFYWKKTFYLEFAAELFLEADFSRAFLKLLALRSSLLKLFTLFSWGLARWGLRRGEFGGRGDRTLRGEGDLETWMSWRSKGLGDLDTAGVDKGDSSLMSQNSSLMSGVDCLLLGQEFSSLLLSIVFWVFLQMSHSKLTVNNFQFITLEGWRNSSVVLRNLFWEESHYLWISNFPTQICLLLMRTLPLQASSL